MQGPTRSTPDESNTPERGATREYGGTGLLIVLRVSEGNLVYLVVSETAVCEFESHLTHQV